MAVMAQVRGFSGGGDLASRNKAALRGDRDHYGVGDCSVFEKLTVAHHLLPRCHPMGAPRAFLPARDVRFSAEDTG